VRLVTGGVRLYPQSQGVRALGFDLRAPLSQLLVAVWRIGEEARCLRDEPAIGRVGLSLGCSKPRCARARSTRAAVGPADALMGSMCAVTQVTRVVAQTARLS
jgi:hypothetical protein